MEFKQLKYFVGIAEALHFSNAAKKLFVSQSALSQQIQLLEDEIGTDLFKRNKRVRLRKVEMTEAGTAFLSEARKILHMREKAIETARHVGLNKSLVRFGIFKTFLKEKIEIIELFTQNFPDIDIEIIEFHLYADVQKAIVEESIDLGLTFAPIKYNDLSFSMFKKGYHTIILQQSHPLAKKPYVFLSDLKNEKWVDIASPINPVQDLVENECIRAGFNRKPTIVQEVTGLELMCSLVSLGIGIAFLPAYIDISNYRNLLMKPILNSDKTPFTSIETSFGLAYKTETSSPLINSFLELIGNN